MTSKKNIENEIKFCGPSCSDWRWKKDVPGCMTHNPGYCVEYKIHVAKSMICYGTRRTNDTN